MKRFAPTCHYRSTGRLTPSTALDWLAAGGGLIAALIAGKVVGLAAARLVLSRTLQRIERAFRTREKGV